MFLGALAAASVQLGEYDDMHAYEWYDFCVHMIQTNNLDCGVVQLVITGVERKFFAN